MYIFLNSTLQHQQPVFYSQGLIKAELVLTGQERQLRVAWDEKLVARLSQLFQFNLFYVLESRANHTRSPGKDADVAASTELQESSDESAWLMCLLRLAFQRSQALGTGLERAVAFFPDLIISVTFL